MKTVCFAILLALVSHMADAAVLYTQLPSPATQTGTLYQSSTWFPEGDDTDRYVYDEFALPTGQAITELRWRGGYAAPGSAVTGFIVSIFGSTPDGQPILSIPDTGTCPNCLMKHTVTGNAGETLLGSFGGTSLYSYVLLLPTPFQAVGGAKYWVQIEALQNGLPTWGLAKGTKTVSDGHREYWSGYSTYFSVAGEAAFEVIGNSPPVASSQVIALKENSTAVLTLSATDGDGNPLTYRVVAQPKNGTLMGSAPNLIYTPAVNFAGADSFAFRANDGFVDSNMATVNINVAYAVRLAGKSDFSRVQFAYNNALAGDRILAQQVLLYENLVFNGVKDVKIEGGYDSAFSTPPVNGLTTVRGSVVVVSGSVSLDRVVIQ